MAMIRLHKGGTFFGRIEDYDFKGKFLVVDVSAEDTNKKRIVSWDNVESVYDSEYKKEEVK